MLAAVALGDGDDQLLPDVAREVEVDVGHGRELPVQEAAEREPGVHRIDVREPGQVADDRADRAPPPAPRRQQVARRAGAAHLGSHVARQLQHLPVEKEEAGEAELGDQRQLRRAGVRPPECGAGAARGGTAPRRLDGRPRASWTSAGVGPIREVRVAVAELVRQVEGEPLGQLDGRADGIRSSGKRPATSPRSEEDALPVPAPLGLAALERRPVLDRDEDVLETRPAQMVRVYVAGGDRADAESLRERAERGVPARVAPLVGPLELDVEAVAAERARRGGRRRSGRGRRARAARSRRGRRGPRPLGEQRRVEARAQPLVGVRGGEEPAEVGIAARRLDEERDVRAVGERHLGAGDGAQAERLRRVGELERAVDAVVVGERERLVAELDRPRRQLLRLRGAVEERVGGVAVELDVPRHALVTPPSRFRHGASQTRALFGCTLESGWWERGAPGVNGRGEMASDGRRDRERARTRASCCGARTARTSSRWRGPSSA